MIFTPCDEGFLDEYGALIEVPELFMFWTCTRCDIHLLDADLGKHPGNLPNGISGWEPKEFWLEGPICNKCAQELGMAR